MFARLRALLAMWRERASTSVAATVEGWSRPSAPCDLTEDQVRYIHAHNTCPYCRSSEGLYTGPRGGASINLFCGNPDCDSR